MRGDPELTGLPLYLCYVMHLVIETFYKYASIYIESKDKQKYFLGNYFFILIVTMATHWRDSGAGVYSPFKDTKPH